MSFRRLIHNRSSWRRSQRKVPTPILSQISHAGYLRKQGTKFKTWKRRYFVLDGQTMLYFEREDRQQFMDSFSVKGHELEVVEPVDEAYYPAARNNTAQEGDKFVFIIKPGESHIRVSESHESYYLAASSEEERNAWLHVLKKAMYRERGGAIFGYPLDEVMDSALTDEEDGVPCVVKDCCDFILKCGIKHEGIFRKCVRRKNIVDLVASYDRGLRPKLLQCADVYTVSCVLKKFLSDLPEPVIPYEWYDSLKASGYYIAEDSHVASVVKRLEELPRNHYILLNYLCRFLRQVAAHSEENRMTTKNLASLFAPHILRCQDSDPNIEASAANLITTTLEAFITHCDTLFVKKFAPSRSTFTNGGNPPLPKSLMSSEISGLSVAEWRTTTGVAATLVRQSSVITTSNGHPATMPRAHSRTAPSSRKTISSVATSTDADDGSPVVLRAALQHSGPRYASLSVPYATTPRATSLTPPCLRNSDITSTVSHSLQRHCDNYEEDEEYEDADNEDTLRNIREVTRRMLQLSRDKYEMQRERDYYKVVCATLQQHNDTLRQEVQHLRTRLSLALPENVATGQNANLS